MVNPPVMDADEEIVAQVTVGKVEMYAELIYRYETRLRRYVVYLIHDQAMAEDVVQETFIKAYQNLRGFNAKYKFSSWIYRIAHNVAMDTIKANRHITDDDVETLPDEQDLRSIEALVDRQILEGDVRECLGVLDAKYREVVQLVYFEHMKYEEAADILHIPISTVGVWLSRAKKRLRGICEQKGEVMMKSPTTISKNVMDRIASGAVRMRPRSYYALIGGLSIGASVLATIASAYGLSIVFFWARIATADTMAYGARVRLSQLAESFPWWAFIGAAALVVGAAYVVRRYGHLYRHKVSTVLLAIVACSLVAGLAMSYMNIGNLHEQNYPGTGRHQQSGRQYR